MCDGLKPDDSTPLALAQSQWKRAMKHEIEIHPAPGGFEVYEWAESRDSGARLGQFRTRRAAILFAEAKSRATGWPIVGAEILPFAEGGRA